MSRNIPDINVSLVTALINEQYPQWSGLAITAVEPGGHDNRTFRLGKELLVRLPSAEGYVLQVEKEQKWLPYLASHLSFSIPEPVALGVPSTYYPWHWSVYRWIEGQSANTLVPETLPMEDVAIELARFLQELHSIDITDTPVLAGAHNFYRGEHPSVYDTDARNHIDQLRNVIDTDLALAVWETALSSRWEKNPVWIHGDFASGNILFRENKLSAVIDFGCMAVGDPACDLTIAWTFLPANVRDVFKKNMLLDAGTWQRARGWALWKASYELTCLTGYTSDKAKVQLKVIHDVIEESSAEIV